MGSMHASGANSSTGTSVAASQEEPLAVPLRSYLRPENIIGGGFVCTKTGMVPRHVISYWERHGRRDP